MKQQDKYIKDCIVNAMRQKISNGYDSQHTLEIYKKYASQPYAPVDYTYNSIVNRPMRLNNNKKEERYERQDTSNSFNKSSKFF